jgi:hypothetical protein
MASKQVSSGLWSAEQSRHRRGSPDACRGNKKPRRSGAFLRLRGRDSNPNFLIQSQASYR